MRRYVLLAVTGVASAAGCSADREVGLLFPSAEARAATARIRALSFSPSSSGSCQSARQAAQDGEVETSARNTADLSFPLDETSTLRVSNTGERLVVLGLFDPERDAPFFLFGCQEALLDEDPLVLTLELLVPQSARLIQAGGDHQVGRPGGQLPLPLRVRVLAEHDGRTYALPGASVRFRAETPSFRFAETTADSLDLYTTLDGTAGASVLLPPGVASGAFLATSPALDHAHGMSGAQVRFTVATVAEPRLAAPVAASVDGAPRALSALTLASGPAVAVLTCAATPAECAAGAGAGELTLLRTPGSLSGLERRSGLGIRPVSLLAADLLPAAGVELAVLAGRRADCQDRRCLPGQPCACFGVAPDAPCPCEGSELLLLSDGPGGLALAGRVALTASNAVGLGSLGGRGLAVAAAGRARDERPCRRTQMCLPYDSPACLAEPARCACVPPRPCEGGVCTPGSADCLCGQEGSAADPCAMRRHPEDWGCPPNEGCECPGCGPDLLGTCRATDEIVDLVPLHASGPADDGCPRPVVICPRSGGARPTCTCADPARPLTCENDDFCSCPVPRELCIGSCGSPSEPHGLVAAELTSAGRLDLIVPSSSGIDFLANLPGGFNGRAAPAMNGPVHAVRAARLDEDPAPDLAWLSRGPCLAGEALDARCPRFVEEEGAGCFGVLRSAELGSVLNADLSIGGACRRYPLPAIPTDLCAADLNGDGHMDIAISSAASDHLALLLGDGRGGLLWPPAEVDLAGARGGPLLCADVDGDGRTDVLLAAPDGALRLFRG